jgi:myosin heavy subunit
MCYRYTCTGWIEKNRDPLPSALRMLLARSTDPFARDVMAPLGRAGDADKPTNGRAAPTVASGFRTSVADLVSELGRGQLHFIRCLNPNMEQRAALVDAAYLLAQLR